MLIGVVVIYCTMLADGSHCRVWPGHSLEIHKPYKSKEPTWGPRH